MVISRRQLLLLFAFNETTLQGDRVLTEIQSMILQGLFFFQGDLSIIIWVVFA